MTSRCDEKGECVWSRACPGYLDGCQLTEPDTPAYVHVLLDALLDGQAIDFGKEFVPSDVQERLAEAVSDGRSETVAT